MAPKFNGAKLAAREFRALSAGARDPGAYAARLRDSGPRCWVRATIFKGKERWKQPGPGTAWGVYFSAARRNPRGGLPRRHGPLAALGLDWKELLAFFVEPQSRKWVAWTPSGYDMASAGGEDLIGWQVNRGWTQGGRLLPRLTIPRRIQPPRHRNLAPQTKDEAEAISRGERQVRPLLRKVGRRHTPADCEHRVACRWHAFFGATTIEIAYSLRSPSGLLIDRLDVLADGQPAEATGFTKATAPTADGRVIVTCRRRRRKQYRSSPTLAVDKWDGKRQTH